MTGDTEGQAARTQKAATVAGETTKRRRGRPSKTQSAAHRTEADERSFVTALARGLEILRCFTPERPTLGTSEIAALTGLPQPTVWRLTSTLVSLGYLSQAPNTNKLHLGASVLALGYAVLSTMDLPRIARMHMQPVANRFHSAVTLGVRDRLGMLFIERTQGESQMLMNLPVGSRIPLATSSLGWAYIAALPDKQRQELFAELAESEGDHWNEIEAPLFEALEFYDKHGFVVNCGLFHPRVNAVGVPLILPGNPDIYSINCGGPATLLTEGKLLNEVGPTMIELARTIREANPRSFPAF